MFSDRCLSRYLFFALPFKNSTQTFKDIEEINKKVMTKKMQEDKQTSKNTLGDANEQLQELKDKMDGK